MPYFLSPIGNSQILDANGDPLVGGTIETYLAGTSTPATTYTDDTGGTAQGVVMTLNSLGRPTLGPVWMLGGVPLKFIIKNALGVVQAPTYDDISGIGDTSAAPDQFPFIAPTPTYISATSFSLAGDQTNDAQINRRIRSINSGGTIYSTITNAVFGAGITTVTVVNDSGVLDAGLSQVNYALLTPQNPSLPTIYVKPGAVTSSGLTISSGKMAGRQSPGTGALEEITIGLRSYLAGCAMSTAGSSTTMSIAAGAAMDSTNAYLMQLTAIAKTTSAWAVGTAQGGKSLAAAIANNTWYHFYAIRRPDTGVTDVAFSTNAAGLLAADYVAGGGNIPDAYTQFRYIGSGLTNGSAQWVNFVQNGDEFLWVAPVLDVDSAAVVAASTLYAMTVPLGVEVDVLIQGFKTGTTGMVNVWSPAVGAIGASTTVAPLGVLYTEASSSASVNQFKARSNTSRQIYMGATAGSQAVKLVTLGYVNRRGRDA